MNVMNATGLNKDDKVNSIGNDASLIIILKPIEYAIGLKPLEYFGLQTRIVPSGVATVIESVFAARSVSYSPLYM